MVGFIKGMAVGLASFALGFAVLSVVLEPDLRPDMPAIVSEPAPETATEQETGASPMASEADVAPPSRVAGESGVVQEEAPREPGALALPGSAVTPGGGPMEELAPMPQADAGPGDEAGVSGEGGLTAEDMPPSAVGESAPEPEPEAAGGIAAPGLADELAIPSEEPAEPAALRAPVAPVEVPLPSDSDAPAEGEAVIDANEAREADAPTETEAPGEPETPGEARMSVEFEAPPEPEAEAVPETAPAAPPVLRAVPTSPGLERDVEGVTVGRLPSIVPDASGAEPEPVDDAQSDVHAAPEHQAEARQPARVRYAAPFDPAPGPLFAVVLLDAPADPAAEAAILALPIPVAVALDPHDADAPRRARRYRAAGHEVVILASGLPGRATASDLAVTFEAWFRALPEAVALIDPVEGGFQANRGLAQAIMPFLADDGHGLITHERGLNPAQQSANSAGVANATVFRVIDSGDENQFTIRRYLDRATFRAQQEGRVVVMGRAAHPETIDGLIGWRMEGRAGQVALVPVSAILRRP